MSKIEIYTDGACKNNGSANNIGAWAYCLKFGEHEKSNSNFEFDTTNNRMELKAVLYALQQIKNRKYDVIVYSDSMYVINGCTIWSKNWQKNMYKNVKNEDLWKRLHLLINNFKNITFTHVKGHSTNLMNNYVDSLCNKSIKMAMSLLEE